MKRSLILPLCAVVMAAIGMSTAQAAVDVALNLRYDNPDDPSCGGTGSLVAMGDSAGLVGLVTRFTETSINGGAGGAGAAVVDGSIGHDINSGALKTGDFGGEREYTYGQDPNGSTPGFVHSVGLVAGPSDQGDDPLNNAAWNNASVIATGLFGGGERPVFLSATANVTDVGNNVSSASTTFTVRGDSVSIDGLLQGDANRDGTVDIDDFNLLAFSYLGAGGWDDGDWNSTGIVDIDDFNLLAFNYLSSSTPPAISGVPEPTSVALALLAGIGLIGHRRRAKGAC